MIATTRDQANHTFSEVLLAIDIHGIKEPQIGIDKSGKN